MPRAMRIRIAHCHLLMHRNRLACWTPGDWHMYCHYTLPDIRSQLPPDLSDSILTPPECSYAADIEYELLMNIAREYPKTTCIVGTTVAGVVGRWVKVRDKRTGDIIWTVTTVSLAACYVWALD